MKNSIRVHSIQFLSLPVWFYCSRYGGLVVYCFAPTFAFCEKRIPFFCIWIHASSGITLFEIVDFNWTCLRNSEYTFRKNQFLVVINYVFVAMEKFRCKYCTKFLTRFVILSNYALRILIVLFLWCACDFRANMYLCYFIFTIYIYRSVIGRICIHIYIMYCVSDKTILWPYKGKISIHSSAEHYFQTHERSKDCWNDPLINFRHLSFELYL